MAISSSSLILSFSHSETIATKFSEINTVNPPNPILLISRCNSIKELMQIQAYAIKYHLHEDVSFITKLINFCTESPTDSSMSYARHLFDAMSEPDIVIFNSMARGYSHSTTPLEAFNLFVEILKDDLRKVMKYRRAVKVPGCSSIEVRNVVHEFFSGAGVKSVTTKLHRALDEMVKELKLAA